MSTKIASSLLWLTAAEILFNLSGYVIHAVSGRVLGPADYGRYGLVVTFTTTLIILIGNGIPTAMSRYLSECFEKDPAMVSVVKRAGARLQILLMAGVTGMFFALSPLISQLLGDSTLTPLFRFSSLIIPAFAASSFYFYYFTGIHHFRHQAILKMSRALLRISVTVPLVIAYKLYGAIAGYILVPLGTFFLGFLFDRQTATPFQSREEGQQERALPWRALLTSAWPITLFLLFYEVFISIDLYLVKIFLKDDAATGYYNAATTLARLPSYLFYALSIVLLPALAKLKSSGDPARVSRLMGDALRFAGILLLPIAVLLIAYGAPIMSLFFGHSYREAVPIFRILVPGLSFLAVFYTVSSGLIGLGKAHLVMWLALAGTIANAVSVAFLIPSLGVSGAAWATTTVTTIITIATLFLMQHFVPTPFSQGAFMNTLLGGILLFAGTLLFPSESAFFLIPATGLAAAYFSFLFWTGVLTRNDVAPILQIFSGKNTAP